MRFLATALCLALMACSHVVPDYNANKVINKPIRPNVYTKSSLYGPNCADTEDFDGTPVRWSIVSVYLWDYEALVTVSLNGRVHAFPLTDRAVLRYPAGVGKHKVQIWVGTPPNVVYREHTFRVYKCERGS